MTKYKTRKEIEEEENPAGVPSLSKAPVSYYQPRADPNHYYQVTRVGFVELHTHNLRTLTRLDSQMLTELQLEKILKDCKQIPEPVRYQGR